eukprot:s1358_g10.t1
MLGEASSQVDCIIPVHEKDYESLGHSVKSLRRFSLEVRRIVVISRSDPGLTDFGVEWLDEASELWPFQISELQHCGCAPGWLLQQLLKLYAPLLVDGLTDHVLVCDADVVWLQPVEFLSSTAAFLCTFDTDSCPPIRSAVDLHRYDSFVPSMLPGLEKARPGKETAAQQLNGRASEYELYGATWLRAIPASLGSLDGDLDAMLAARDKVFVTNESLEDSEQDRQRSAKEVEELQQQLSKAAADAWMKPAECDSEQDRERSAKEVEELQQQLSKAAADAWVKVAECVESC